MLLFLSFIRNKCKCAYYLSPYFEVPFGKITGIKKVDICIEFVNNHRQQQHI